jgi:hypothetical protein
VLRIERQLANFGERQAAKNAIDMFGLLRPSICVGFKSVTMMGACMEDLLVYRYWRSLDVQFEPHPVIKPRFTKYPNVNSMIDSNRFQVSSPTAHRPPILFPKFARREASPRLQGE